MNFKYYTNSNDYENIYDHNFNTVNNHQDWHGNFYKPYDTNGCMAKYFESKNILANTGDSFHYGPDAQSAWATELSNYTKTNIL